MCMERLWWPLDKGFLTWNSSCLGWGGGGSVGNAVEVDKLFFSISVVSFFSLRLLTSVFFCHVEVLLLLHSEKCPHQIGSFFLCMVAPQVSLRVAASGLTDTSKAISLNLWISQPVWYFSVSHILLGDNICFPFPPFTCLDCKCSVSSIRTWPTQQEDLQPAQSHPVCEADQSHLASSHHEKYLNPWLTQVLSQCHEVAEPLEKQDLLLMFESGHMGI